MAGALEHVLGSVHVLEGARHGGARKIVFASSGGTIYGEPDASALPVKESHPQQPVSPYGVAKRVVTDYLHAYRELYELEYTSLALANVYGPRQDPHGEAGVVAIFAGHLLDRRPCLIYGDGEPDARLRVRGRRRRRVRAGRGAGERAALQHRDRRETSVNELYATMAAAAGVAEPPERGPARAGEMARNALDPGRAKLHLGWEPWTDLATGVTEVLAWFRT